MRTHALSLAIALALAGATGCTGATGPAGADGMDGMDGMDGTDGRNGMNGTDGTDGMDGMDGADGADGTDGMDGMDGEGFDDSSDIPTHVVSLVDQVAAGTLSEDVVFPLEATATDQVRAIEGLRHATLARWLEPLTFATGASALYFGANADYVSFFGDGWDATAGDAPQWNGSGNAGWLWVNHEYVSNAPPTLTTAPIGQHFTLAEWLRTRGILTTAPDSATWAQGQLDVYNIEWRRQVGGSWLRVVRDPSSGTWAIDRNVTPRRYDATSATLALVTGMTVSADHDDAGTALPVGVVAGIHSNCAGTTTPWGTIITAEENAQGAYGDLETCWSSSQRFLSGQGCDPGAMISFTTAPSTSADFGRHSDPNTRHPRDAYSFLVEIDPGQPASEYYGRTTAGIGHRKLGAIGRAHWEGATFATNGDWELVAGQPIVIYAGDDRQSGRIFRFVTSAPYTAGMTRAQIRALLDDGTLYVAHFEDMGQNGFDLGSGMAPTEAMRGAGRWIELSLTSTDIAPNAAALGMPAMTVGQALASTTWNGIGGFASDDDVRRALFTACNKIGVRELNRPEELEWNPRDPSGTSRLYVAFTNQTRQRALDTMGRLVDPATHSAMAFNPNDRVGSIFAMEEAMPTNPAMSRTFTFFRVWRGSSDRAAMSAANPDNILIDGYGHVWFGTDGNFGTAGHADGVYYLDLDPAHRTTPTVTYGMPFRVFGAASDAEASGPAFSPDMRTLFVSVQHPGEELWSTWPSTDLRARPLSGVVALTRGVPGL